MKSHRIAVTGVSGDAGFGIVQGLRQGYPNAEILGLDYNSDCAARHLCDQYQTMPGIYDKTYIPELIRVLASRNVELLIPGIDAELSILSDHRHEIERETNTALLLCEHSRLMKCTDKLDTFRWLREIGFSAPHTISPFLESELLELEHILDEFQNQFPIVIKPRQGHGSIGIRYVHNADELASQLPSLTPDDCLQQYIEGPEITCGLLFDQNGLLADFVCMQRILKNGRTISASVYENPELNDFIKSFGTKSRLTGPINLQLRIDQSGQPQVFEINPRLSGSTQIRIAVGFNDPARLVEHYLDNQPIQAATIQNAHVYRTESTLVVNPPDTCTGRKTQQSSFKGNLIRNIILKCEGVLLNQIPDRSLLCQRVLNRLGYQIPLQEIRQAYATVDFAIQYYSPFDFRENNTPGTNNNSYHIALAAALGVSSLQTQFDSLLQTQLDQDINWIPVTDAKESLDALLSCQQINLHVWSTEIVNLSESLRQSFPLETVESLQISEITDDGSSVQSIFDAFANDLNMSPDNTICIGNQYEPEVRLCREKGFFPILLDLEQQYARERDCPSFSNWQQLNQFLSTLLQDCEQEISNG